MKSLTLHLSGQQMLQQSESDFAPQHIAKPVEETWTPQHITPAAVGLLHVRPLPEFTTALHRIFKSIPHVHPVPVASQN